MNRSGKVLFVWLEEYDRRSKRKNRGPRVRQKSYPPRNLRLIGYPSSHFTVFVPIPTHAHGSSIRVPAPWSLYNEQ